MGTSPSDKGMFAFQLEGENHLLQTGQSSYSDDGFGQRSGGIVLFQTMTPLQVRKEEDEESSYFKRRHLCKRQKKMKKSDRCISDGRAFAIAKRS